MKESNMTNFPVRVRYIDKDEVQVVKSYDEIQKGRAFVVDEIKWGRKVKVSNNIPIEE
jgi:hypothetical protein